MSRDAPNQAPVAPAPSVADIGVVAALPIELGAFLDRCRAKRAYQAGSQKIVEAVLGNQIIVTIAAGMGGDRAKRGTELLLAGHRPRWILSTGFAGALAPDLERGSIILPDRLTDAAGRHIEIDVHVPQPTNGRSWRQGRLLTVDQVVRTSQEKAELRARTGADMVDMESFSVAQLCAERSLRFLSVRVISDDARTELPPEVLTLVGPTGGYRIGAAVGALLKRPSSLSTMLRLRDHAQASAQALGAALAEIIPALK